MDSWIIISLIITVSVIIYIVGYRYTTYLAGYDSGQKWDGRLNDQDAADIFMAAAWPIFIWYLFFAVNPLNIDLSFLKANGTFQKGINKAKCDKERNK